MPKCMSGGSFTYIRCMDSLSHHSLKCLFVEMEFDTPTVLLTKSVSSGWKDKLPNPFLRSIRVLPGQGSGEIYFSQAFFQIMLME